MSEESFILSFMKRLEDRLEEQTERTIERLFAIETRTEGTRVQLVEVNRRLDVANKRMDEANHRTSKNEDAIEAIALQQLKAASTAQGREEVREELRGKVKQAWDFGGSVATKTVAGVGLFMAGFTLTQIREVWPW